MDEAQGGGAVLIALIDQAEQELAEAKKALAGLEARRKKTHHTASRRRIAAQHALIVVARVEVGRLERHVANLWAGVGA